VTHPDYDAPPLDSATECEADIQAGAERADMDRHAISTYQHKPCTRAELLESFAADAMKLEAMRARDAEPTYSVGCLTRRQAQ